MEKHLYYYPNHTALKSSTDLKNIHNVVYCDNEAHVHYDYHDYSEDYFTIESLEDGNNLYFGSLNSNPNNFGSTVLYSLDNGSTWEQYTASKSRGNNTPIPLNMNSKVLFKTMNSVKHYDHFYLEKTFKVYGNIMSLIYGDEFIGQNNLNGIDAAFKSLLYDNINLVDASNLVLPATILSQRCYDGMFSSCTSLTTAPQLPAATLASNCYQYMFSSCTSLVNAPELPVTTLAENCYQYMFRNCTSLTIAPELPATSLATKCYEHMFYGCTSLNYIKAMFKTTPNQAYTGNWVDGVASTGTFVKNAAATWNVTGVHGIPTGWTVQTASN